MKHFLYILYIAFSAALPARTLAEGGEGVPPCVKIAGEPTAAIYNRYNKEIRFLIPEDESGISQFRQVLVASYASPEGSYQHCRASVPKSSAPTSAAVTCRKAAR